MKSAIEEQGFCTFCSAISEGDINRLQSEVFQPDAAGTRCLLDVPIVAEVAMKLKRELEGVGMLPTNTVAIQAITFDKTSDTNWKVAWHQDLMFPFARPVKAPGYAVPCVKDGVDFARPPREVLDGLLAVRLHLDDCDESNGPLRVVPGSHREGVITGAKIADRVAALGEVACLAPAGTALLMRPLLLHASSKALQPRHRRVLHLVYYSGPAMDERWHREIGCQVARASCP